MTARWHFNQPKPGDENPAADSRDRNLPI